MRDSHLPSVVTETEKRVEKYSEMLFALLRTSVCDSPNFLDIYEPDLILPKNEKDILRLLILINLVDDPEHFDVMVRVQLEERLSKYDELSWMKILLQPAMLREYIIQNVAYHSREWFGNILREKDLLNLVQSLRFKRRNRKVKKIQRKRGYTDKGSLKPANELPGELSPRYLETYELEEKRLLHDSTLDFLEGMLM